MHARESQRTKASNTYPFYTLTKNVPSLDVLQGNNLQMYCKVIISFLDKGPSTRLHVSDSVYELPDDFMHNLQASQIGF
jgi:hypothetical protein